MTARSLARGAMMTHSSAGYLSPHFAASLAEIGRPKQLRHSGGWILERNIPGTQRKDAMGCYPIFSCQNWLALTRDVDELNNLVSLVLVTDPFGEYDITLLRRSFPQLAVPFKSHYVADLRMDPDEYVSNHHKRNIRKALATVDVVRCDSHKSYTDTLERLYQHLISTHSIKGPAAFSPRSLRQQMEVPGLEVYVATHNRHPVGIALWFVQNQVAYYHLGAYNEVGYQTRSSFAIFWTALRSFARQGIRWVSLGAAAGLRDEPTSGLARFKRGWSTGTKTAWLCGRILDPEAYETLSGRKPGDNDYFPLYRKGQYE